MEKCYLIFGLVTSLLFSQNVHHAAADSSFAFACGQLLGGDSGGSCTVMMHSYTDTTALLRSADDTSGTQYTITAGQTLSVDLSGTERVVEGIETKTFYVTSDDDITVHVSNTGSSSTYSVIDAVEVYPQGDADTEFYIVNLGSPDTEQGCSGYTAFYSVCAYADDTTVSVYRKSSGSLVLDDEYTLDEFEVFTERHSSSGLIEENFSGYVIRTSQDASVYAGNRCYSHTTQHSTWSSIPPVNRLGTTYASYNFDTTAYQYMVKIVATDNDTVVSSTSSGMQATIDQADVVEFVYAGSEMSVVECSKPCVAMQIVNGTSDEAGVSQQVLNPTNSMITQGLFSVPSVYLESSYEALVLHVIHNSNDGQGLTLNGASLDSLNWQPAGDNYVYATDTTLTFDTTYDIVSSTGAFSALVSGVEQSNKGFMFNVAQSTGAAPTPPPDAPTPQHSIVLSGDFVSSDGSDFTLDCAADYQQELFEKAVTVSADVNNLIGTSLCIGKTSDDINIETITTQFAPTGSEGSNVITHYLTADALQSPSDIEACATEIANYLIPHSNWGEPILPTLPGCPGVDYTSDMWNHDGNEWVCFDTARAAGTPSAQVSLAYSLSMLGEFTTGSGENLTVECRNAYTEDFLFATIEQSARVNDLLGTTLCSGVDIVIDDSSVTLNSFGSQGQTTQDYSFALGGDIGMSEVTVCVNEVSAYLSDHINWRQPIIETDPPCPDIVFDPQSFTEQDQLWLCRE